MFCVQGSIEIHPLRPIFQAWYWWRDLNPQIRAPKARAYANSATPAYQGIKVSQPHIQILLTR